MSTRAAQALDVEAQVEALGDEIAAVMGPLLAPLVEKWEWVTGDDEQVHETARRWRAMTESVTRAADDQRASAARVVGEWDGMAHRAFDVAVATIDRELRSLAERTSDVADLIERAAVAVREAERIVGGLIRGLIEWAAVSLGLSAAGAVVTLPASAIAGAAAAAAKAGVVGARIATRLGQLALELRRIQVALGAYEVWVTGLAPGQRRLVGGVQGAVVKDLADLAGGWQPPAIDLVDVVLEPRSASSR